MAQLFDVGWARSRTVTSLTLLASILVSAAARAAQSSAPVTCRIDGPVVSLADLPEASGVAASRLRQNILWSHNDSGEPLVVGVDATGAIKELVRPTGTVVEDWEDIAVGPCPQGSCVYIADIGDNASKRARITVYRFREPAADVSEAAAEQEVASFDLSKLNEPQGEGVAFGPNDAVYVVGEGRHEAKPGTLARLSCILRP